MKNFNIESYLEGELSGTSLQVFEAEMRSNPAFVQTIKRMSQLKDDLEMQSLREEVKNILKPERSEPNQKGKPGRWMGLLVGAALLCVTTYFLLPSAKENVVPHVSPIEKNEEPPLTTPPQIEETNEKESVPLIKEELPVIKKTKTKQSRPIAENNSTTSLPLPLHPAPNVRGQNDQNKAWKAMLDQVWYTDFPPINVSPPFSTAADLLKERDFKKAFVKLELLEMKTSTNDTLRLLKGYCLLEMGEGGDALRYFEQMEKPPIEWTKSLDWYRALAILTSKGIADALPVFKKITENKKHDFYLQSKKALEVLE